MSRKILTALTTACVAMLVVHMATGQSRTTAIMLGTTGAIAVVAAVKSLIGIHRGERK